MREMMSNFTYFKHKVLLYKDESHLSDCHIDNSTMSASIETGVAQNESCVFWDHGVYFKSQYVQLFINMSAQKAWC